jgi:hypothetical protein
MNSQQAGTLDTSSTVRRLIGELGLAALVGLMADMTEEESEALSLSGETLKAAQYKREARILHRAATQLRN